MTHIPLIYAPHNIFRQKAQKLDNIDQNTRLLIERMFETLYLAHGIGMAATMVGVLKRIVIIDLQENGQRTPIILINPEINYYSEEKQSFTEASLSFPGIEAEITRPKTIRLTYSNLEGNIIEQEATGFLATVMQHEIDYLDGKIFLDYLSKLKRDTLIRKMQKHIKQYPPHIHTASCTH